MFKQLFAFRTVPFGPLSAIGFFVILELNRHSLHGKCVITKKDPYRGNILKARSHCDGNGIIFNIFVSSIVVAVTHGYSGHKHRCSHGDGNLKTLNCHCRNGVNKALRA